MRLLGVVLALVVLCVCRGAAGVLVKAGDRSFPLEAVKQLDELMGSGNSVGPHLTETGVMAVCMNPLLPRVFRRVCHEKGARITLSQLVYTIRSTDPCEICANPACYGC